MSVSITREELENFHRRLKNPGDSPEKAEAAAIISSVMAKLHAEYRTEQKLQNDFLSKNFDTLIKRASDDRVNRKWAKKEVSQKAKALIKKEFPKK